jgi:hypothetical protein
MSAVRSASNQGMARYFNGLTLQGLLIAAISGCLFWVVWIYGNALRDPSYLTGWLLACSPWAGSSSSRSSRPAPR